MAYTAPAQTASSSAGFYDVVPIGMFEVDSNAVSAVTPLLSVTGAGYLENLGLREAQSVSDYMIIDLEIDGVLILSAFKVYGGSPLIGSTPVNGVTLYTANSTLPPIKFETSLKIWLTEVTSGKYAKAYGRLF